MLRAEPSHPEEVGGWCAISGQRVIGPIFFGTHGLFACVRLH